MNENKLLNDTLELIGDDGTENAYEYLLSNLEHIDKLSSQVYNFLYCLAATSGKQDEALDWLEEAILEKGLWYRPELFEDEDLDSIREDDRFKEYSRISLTRYLEAQKTVETVFTWREVKGINLIIVLHGNQQNNEISKMHWSEINSPENQVEYLQSHEIDSYQLFRWEDRGDGPIQLKSALGSIGRNTYSNRILAGFSAGCNTILRAIKSRDVECEKIILLSPWMPCIQNEMDELVGILLSKNIEMLVICGLNDEECLSQSIELDKKSKEMGLNCKTVLVEGLGHEYPDQFKEIILEFL